MRTLTYAQAIREAHRQLLAADRRVFLIGQGLWSPWYAGGSLEDLDREFGRERVLDSPVSENAVTGMAVGAALAGMRPDCVSSAPGFSAAGDGSGDQSGRQLVVFVRRASQRPAGDPGGDQSRRRAGRPALAGLACHVHARARA